MKGSTAAYLARRSVGTPAVLPSRRLAVTLHCSCPCPARGGKTWREPKSTGWLIPARVDELRCPGLTLQGWWHEAGDGRSNYGEQEPYAAGWDGRLAFVCTLDVLLYGGVHDEVR